MTRFADILASYRTTAEITLAGHLALGGAHLARLGSRCARTAAALLERAHSREVHRIWARHGDPQAMALSPDGRLVAVDFSTLQFRPTLAQGADWGY